MIVTVGDGVVVRGVAGAADNSGLAVGARDRGGTVAAVGVVGHGVDRVVRGVLGAGAAFSVVAVGRHGVGTADDSGQLLAVVAAVVVLGSRGSSVGGDGGTAPAGGPGGGTDGSSRDGLSVAIGDHVEGVAGELEEGLLALPYFELLGGGGVEVADADGLRGCKRWWWVSLMLSCSSSPGRKGMLQGFRQVKRGPTVRWIGWDRSYHWSSCGCSMDQCEVASCSFRPC